MMFPKKVTIYYNKTLFIGVIIACFCGITPWAAFLFLYTDGFKKIVLDDTFFMFTVFLLLSLSTLIIFLYRPRSATPQKIRQP